MRLEDSGIGMRQVWNGIGNNNVSHLTVCNSANPCCTLGVVTGDWAEPEEVVGVLLSL